MPKMSLEETFSHRFKCPKCHHKGAHTHRMHTTPETVEAEAETGYLAVSCPLCGFTEFYNIQTLTQQSHWHTVIDTIFGH
ncbi:MAG TPA: hypothetical protein DIW24_06660 [Bacteroidetes bacterium]|nr:hypothetical protein [Bacteroidota bacterium]HRR09339.1 zinc ribbon domain-containing protein [Rhodothermales bacterium]